MCLSLSPTNCHGSLTVCWFSEFTGRQSLIAHGGRVDCWEINFTSFWRCPVPMFSNQLASRIVSICFYTHYLYGRTLDWLVTTAGIAVAEASRAWPSTTAAGKPPCNRKKAGSEPSSPFRRTPPADGPYFNISVERAPANIFKESTSVQKDQSNGNKAVNGNPS